MLARATTFATLVAACTPYEPTLSQAPFLCGTTDPKCPDGYTCMDTGTSAECVSMVTTCPDAFSGELAKWQFTGETGSQVSTDATSIATGVTATPVTRSAGLVVASGSDSINSSNWPTAASRDTTVFYTVSLTAPAECLLDVSSVAIDVKSSTTGPASAAVATDSDAFAQAPTISTTAPTTLTLPVSGARKLEVRIYGFGATATSGTMRVENELSISGVVR